MKIFVMDYVIAFKRVTLRDSEGNTQWHVLIYPSDSSRRRHGDSFQPLSEFRGRNRAQRDYMTCPGPGSLFMEELEFQQRKRVVGQAVWAIYLFFPQILIEPLK